MPSVKDIDMLHAIDYSGGDLSDLNKKLQHRKAKDHALKSSMM